MDPCARCGDPDARIFDDGEPRPLCRHHREVALDELAEAADNLVRPTRNGRW